MQEPMTRFETWFEEAKTQETETAHIMALGTVTPEGSPNTRMVLMRGSDAQGIRFFTNYGSVKAQELDENPNASACFHWRSLDRQVRILGVACKLSRAENEAYWETRPRESKIAAWASHQSTPIGSRAALEREFETKKDEFAGHVIPLPDFWGGYRITPVRIEFWEGMPHRLHHREVFVKEAGEWRRRLLAP